MFTGTLSPEHNPQYGRNCENSKRTSTRTIMATKSSEKWALSVGAAVRVLDAMETSECQMPRAETFLSLIFFRRRSGRSRSEKETFGTEGTTACRTCTCTRNLFCFQCSCVNWWKFQSIGCPCFCYRSRRISSNILSKIERETLNMNDSSAAPKNQGTVFAFEWNGAIECVSAQCGAWMCACVVLVSKLVITKQNATANILLCYAAAKHSKMLLLTFCFVVSAQRNRRNEIV